MNRRIGVILSYVLMIFEVLSTLLLTPFIISSLGQAEYGVYKLAASVVAYLALLDLGIGNAVTRYVAKFRTNNEVEQNRRFLGVAIIYYSLIAVITVALGVVLIAVFPTAFAKGLSVQEIELGQKLLGITMINTAVTLGTAAFPNVINGYERFAFSKTCSILQIVIRIALTLTALNLGMKSLAIVSINLLLTVLSRGAFIIYVFFKIKLRPLFKGLEWKFIREVTAYSSFILLQMVATQINAFADQILLGMFVASSSVIIAVYGVGAQIVQYFQSIGTSFTGVLMPGVVSMVEKGAGSEDLRKEMVRIGRIIFMVLLLIWGCFLLYGKQFVSLWAGEANINGYYVAIILMTAYLFILTESIGTQILWAKNAHKEQSVLKIAIVIANLFLTVLLIKWDPLIGATIGTFISLFVGDVIVMNIVFVRKIGINIFKYYLGLFKGIIPSFIITLACGYLFSYLSLSGWIGFILNISMMVSVYAVSMWLIGLNSYEKGLILSIIKKLLGVGKNKIPEENR